MNASLERDSQIFGEQPNMIGLSPEIVKLLEKFWKNVDDLVKVVLTPEARLYVDSTLKKKELQIDMYVNRRHNDRILATLKWIDIQQWQIIQQWQQLAA